MDSVNNRSLFRRKSQAARDKVRQMGRVQEPQGILASFQELMQVAGRDRTQNLMPRMMQQPRPVRLQEGGDIAMEALLQGAPEPSLGQQFAAIQQSAMAPQVDIAATPTPRAPVEVPDIATMVRSNLGDNQEAQAKFTELETALTDPEASDEQRQEAITSAAGVENTREGLRSVASQITGRELPESATVDELNRAITGVALGGAIGGPRSVAARISEALLVGLQAQRETAVGREQFAQQLAIATAKAKAEGTKGFLETPRGEAALEMYNEFLSQEFMPGQAYARMNEISPGLGDELERAMSGAAAAPGTPAAAPAAVPAPVITPPATPEEKEQILREAREALADPEYANRRELILQALRDADIDPAEL
jgi:hypothetical protein